MSGWLSGKRALLHVGGEGHFGFGLMLELGCIHEINGAEIIEDPFCAHSRDSDAGDDFDKVEDFKLHVLNVGVDAGSHELILEFEFLLGGNVVRRGLGNVAVDDLYVDERTIKQGMPLVFFESEFHSDEFH